MASLKVEDATPEPLVQEAPDVDDGTFYEEAITSGRTYGNIDSSSRPNAKVTANKKSATSTMATIAKKNVSVNPPFCLQCI